MTLNRETNFIDLPNYIYICKTVLGRCFDDMQSPNKEKQILTIFQITSR